MITSSRFPLVLAVLLAFSLTLTSCDTIGTIFKAGAWTGIIAVVVVLALVLFVVNRFRGSK